MTNLKTFGLLLMLGASLSATAQQNTPNVPTVFTQGRGNVYAANGNIDFSNMDFTQILSAVEKEIFQRQSEDKTFVLGQLAEVESAFNSMYSNIVLKKLEKFSLDNAQGKYYSADQFFDLKVEYA